MKLVILCGDLLAEDTEALVNTVNCVGVMGKGVALQFKNAFPGNFKAYAKQCKAKEIHPGKMFVFDNSTLEKRQFLINFPTKQHWRGNSKIEWISEGLDDLVRVLRELRIKSISIPPLGCGNGGLSWTTVRAMIEKKLSELEDVEVRLFEPSSCFAHTPSVNRQAKPQINRLRASIFKVCERYKSQFDETISHLVIQKLMYFFEIGNGKNALSFIKGSYGPYSQKLKREIDKINGHYLRGFKSNTHADIYPEKAEQGNINDFFYLSQNKDLRERFDRVCDLIVGFETAFNMELLASVHWVCEHEGAKNASEAFEKIRGWTKRKAMIFDERMVRIAFNRLKEQGWIK